MFDPAAIQTFVHLLHTAAIAGAIGCFTAAAAFEAHQRAIRAADARGDDRRKREALYAARLREAARPRDAETLFGRPL